jgi:hypothetical protein
MQVCDGSVLGGVPGQGMWNEKPVPVRGRPQHGLIEWTRNLSFVHDQALSIPSLALDPQGRLWYAVSEWGVGKAVRVDESGADMETRIVDGVRTLGTISFDPWGGLYMSGGCENVGFAFGGEAFTNEGTTGYSMFVLRYKPDGTAGFAEFADDITFQEPQVVATADGHAYSQGGSSMARNGATWNYTAQLVGRGLPDALGQYGGIHLGGGKCAANTGTNNRQSEPQQRPLHRTGPRWHRVPHR